MAIVLGTDSVCAHFPEALTIPTNVGGFDGAGGELSLFRDADVCEGVIGVRAVFDESAVTIGLSLPLARQVAAHLLAMIGSIEQEGA
ncbi:MAG: hypothetical protein EPN21_07910 [Methylococcaceae bacterium]|nr:MAG: hypothetical protein EPN21_07910 [Methylococcaceae bacterium]